MNAIKLHFAVICITMDVILISHSWSFLGLMVEFCDGHHSHDVVLQEENVQLTQTKGHVSNDINDQIIGLFYTQREQNKAQWLAKNM